MYVATETVEFSHRHATSEFPRGSECRLEVGTAVQRVRALTRLHLHELPDHFETFGSRELNQRVALGLDAETRAALPGR
jgi:hypothetical protein